jgi:hypothetical protein
VSHAEHVLDIDPWLAYERHPGQQSGLDVPLVEVRQLVCFDADAMANSVSELCAVAGGEDDVAGGDLDGGGGGVGREVSD